jgi:hypothetical protein
MRANAQEREITPYSNASLAIFVLPIDLRSFIVRVLNERFVDPAAPIVASPDFSKDEPAGHRSPWDDDSSKMPDFRPGGFCTQAQHLKVIVPACFHFRRRAPSV